MLITNQDVGDRVLVRRRVLVDWAAHMVLSEKFSKGKAWVDLFEEELMQDCCDLSTLPDL